jgi:hypothetical protein
MSVSHRLSAVSPFLSKVMKNLDQNTRQLLMDSQKGSKDQAIRDRYHGTNDTLADKYLARATSMALEPPSDPSVKSLWIGGVQEGITQEDIKDKFYSFGELTNIKLVTAQKCAFVEVRSISRRFLAPMSPLSSSLVSPVSLHRLHRVSRVFLLSPLRSPLRSPLLSPLLSLLLSLFTVHHTGSSGGGCEGDVQKSQYQGAPIESIVGEAGEER